MVSNTNSVEERISRPSPKDDDNDDDYNNCGMINSVRVGNNLHNGPGLIILVCVGERHNVE